MRKHNEGSVYQRREGTWHASISLPGGRRRTVTAKSEAEAHERLAVLRRDAPQRKLFIRSSREAFAELIVRHLDWAASEGWGQRMTAKVMAHSLSNSRIQFGICGPCVYCGTPFASCVDHVVPRARGGTDDPSNLASACWSCNTAKGAMPVADFLVSRIRGQGAKRSAAREVVDESEVA